MRTRIFISSVQKELAAERRALKDYIRGDPLLRRFFDVFLFEDLPASDRRPDDVYLDEVDRCGIYLGVFGIEYGREGADGLSPTEREFDRAAGKGKVRLIFVKGASDDGRSPKMLALVRRAGAELIRRRFEGVPELTAAVYASLVGWLNASGIIQDAPFDERSCPDARLDDLDADAVKSFVQLARATRDFPLPEETPMEEVLTHLALLRNGRPTNGAVLLFGEAPQRFVPCAEVRCMHFHGTEIVRPAPFYRIFKGPLFAQVDEAANFVLSVTNVSVGTRALGAQAAVKVEIPRDVIQEAIVNAVVHRDYTSNAAIQVAVFSDRVEIWNPGELLPPLTPDSLRVPHRSITRNHRICESMFLAGYIEKYGTGTLMMIRESVEHALPEPLFKQTGGEFVAVLGRDWLTEGVLGRLNLSDRQFRAVMHVKLHGVISNSVYRGIAGVSESTALRDLRSLAEMGLLEKTEGTGRTARYELARAKAVTNTPKASSPPVDATSRKPVKPVAGADGGGGLQPNTGQRNRVVGTVAGQTGGRAGTKSGPSRDQVALLRQCRQERAIGDLMTVAGRSNRTKFRDQVLNPLLAAGVIEMTIPDKPTSRLQKYRLTEKGRAWLADDDCGKNP